MQWQLDTPIPPGYLRHLGISIGLQLFVLTFGALTMDGGMVLQFAFLSLPAYWFMALMVMLRRGKNPSNGDLMIIRYGYLYVLLGILIFTVLQLRLK